MGGFISSICTYIPFISLKVIFWLVNFSPCLASHQETNFDRLPFYPRKRISHPESFDPPVN